MARLSADDIDGLTDLADRLERVVRTARSAADDELGHDQDAVTKLRNLATTAGFAALDARAVADHIERREAGRG